MLLAQVRFSRWMKNNVNDMLPLRHQRLAKLNVFLSSCRTVFFFFNNEVNLFSKKQKKTETKQKQIKQKIAANFASLCLNYIALC